MGASQQDVDDKSISYPTSGMSLHSSYTSSYSNEYSEHSSQHSGDSSHHHFLQSNSRAGQAPTSSPAYYIASQLANPKPEKEKGFSFTKVMLCLLVVLILGITIMSLLVWILVGCQTPILEVEAFSVPKFDINSTSLHALWAANISITNPNKKLTLSFGHIGSRLIYKEFIMDGYNAEPIIVDSLSRGRIMLKFSVPTRDSESDKELWMKSMKEDYLKGNIFFNVGFVMDAKLSSGDFWKSKIILAVMCENLEVIFEDGGVGKWNPTKHECY